ncbi:MAG: general secretion pathway protein GspK [Verrucomicrobia bacterium]|jgi:type II secretory pathway component PulK|nr:general secretion pathway protein GspK [Verrucomicrobiota bacterium]|tara:strand:- start:47416 stop:48348 length:933 start_codon:yes stop_codon:yes gene_type:complete
MRTSTPPSQKGAALIAVLWLIAILGLAAVTTLRVISFDMEVVTAKIHGSRAFQLAEMGIAIGCNPSVERNDPLLHRMDEANNEEINITLTSEGARFNINTLIFAEDKTLIRSIFIHWGLDLDSAQALTDAFTDWTDRDDQSALNGAEVEDYEKIGRLNQPFNRPFYDIEEMRLVLGMDQIEALRPDWRDWFTVWSSGTLDLNEADAELISVAADVTESIASIIPETVRGTDDVRDTEDDVPFQDVTSALSLLGIGGDSSQLIAARFTTDDTTIRITSTARSGDAKRRITAIVRNRTGRPALLDRTTEIVP